MQTTITQAAAEQAIHDALEADDERMLEAFADFAAGEIDDKHIAALLLSFLPCGKGSRNPAIAAAIGQMKAIEVLKTELDRKRAAFIEHQATQAVRDEEAHQLATAELDK